MGPLTIQILILIASFLFYRILKSGFDSWKAILLDFGIVLFLFGLQYYLQSKQQNTASNETTMFPSGSLSTLLGVSFPSKIETDLTTSLNNLASNVNNSNSSKTTKGTYLVINDSIFLESNEKRMISFVKKFEQGDTNLFQNNLINIRENGFYLIQLTCQTDIVPYHAKLSLVGSKNQIQKSIHDGENNFIVHLVGEDFVYFEIENTKSNVMLLDNTSMYFIKL